MGKLVPGGRQYIQDSNADLAEVHACVGKARRSLRLNPLLAEELLGDALRLLTRLDERLVDLEGMLERVQVRREHAGLADRVAALEDWKAAVESGKVVPLLRRDV
jgi:hypothetical protein